MISAAVFWVLIVVNVAIGVWVVRNGVAAAKANWRPGVWISAGTMVWLVMWTGYDLWMVLA